MAALLGANLRVARLEAGLTQRELAERIGCESMLVSKWERGRHLPSAGYLDALAENLGRSVAWFHSEPAERAA